MINYFFQGKGICRSGQKKLALQVQVGMECNRLKRRPVVIESSSISRRYRKICNKMVRVRSQIYALIILQNANFQSRYKI